ncbi:MAG: hypothetical protein ABJB39_11380 [Chloroflexota bacterium]
MPRDDSIRRCHSVVQDFIERAPLPPLPAHVPAGVRMIARCLTRDPGQRYQTARELRAALEAVQSDVSIAPAATRVVPRRRTIDWRIIAGGLAVALVGGTLARQHDRTHSDPLQRRQSPV